MIIDTETVVCIATGASLTQQDVNYIKGSFDVIAIKEAIMLAPWATYMYACDDDYWLNHGLKHKFKGRKYSIKTPSLDGLDIIQLPYELGAVWGDRKTIATGGNSGFQAIGLAHILGYRRVLLLGYDMQSKDNQTHFWDGVSWRSFRPHNYKGWLQHFKNAAPLIKNCGIEVINCTRDTALDCFPKMSIQDAVAYIQSPTRAF